MNSITDDYKTIEIEGLLVTKKASDIIDRLWHLKGLDLPACWIFQGDDSPEHYATCESLILYLSDFGGKLIRLESCSIELIHNQSISSGRFLIQLD